VVTEADVGMDTEHETRLRVRSVSDRKMFEAIPAGCHGLMARKRIRSRAVQFVTGELTAGSCSNNRWDNREEIREPVRIERGRVGFMDGEWFICPLLKPNGTPCNRRCRILYLPPGAKYFGCRECYNLTYDSCNESHKYERNSYFRGLAAEVGMTASELNEMFSAKPKRRRRRA
jgi:hypothetical protein